MHKLLKLFFIILLVPSLTQACIWIDGTTIDGEYISRGGHSYSEFLKQTVEKVSPQTKLKEILKNKIDNEEDKAVILLLKGEYENAIESLLKLNNIYPNKYSIASNLGTTYELNGENEKALQWIKEGIKRDTKSHYGTEWLHVYILKMKIKLNKEPNFLQHNRMIPLQKSFTAEDSILIDNHSHTIVQLKKALNYQLQERIVFVKPKEAIVADLFFTLAQIEAKTKSIEDAMGYLELAELYGFSNPQLLDKIKKSYQDTIENPSFFYHFHLSTNLIPMIIFISFFLIVYILVKRVIVFIYQKLIKQSK